MSTHFNFCSKISWMTVWKMICHIIHLCIACTLSFFLSLSVSVWLAEWRQVCQSQSRASPAASHQVSYKHSALPCSPCQIIALAQSFSVSTHCCWSSICSASVPVSSLFPLPLPFCPGSYTLDSAVDILPQLCPPATTSVLHTPLCSVISSLIHTSPQALQ